ncbi:MAG: stage II sporulation protein M [Candidatus Woesearchaeota archaeon]
MVLESLINPIKAENHPVAAMWLGFLYSTVALFLSLWIFRDQASLVMVFLTVMACIPLVYNTIKLEELKDLKIEKESILIKEHGKAIAFFMFLFFGFTLAFALWYTVLPSEILHSAFSTQTQTISSLNSQVTGNAFMKFGAFNRILFNNLKVLIFCILFAFLYGVGAIFILAWNASVIGVAIGNFIRSNLGAYAEAAHLVKIGSYLHVISLGLLRYSIHGIPEIMAYFVAGLAGGIISIAVIRHDMGTEKFEHIVLDSSELIVISLIFVFLAAFLEVYVTPILF